MDSVGLGLVATVTVAKPPQVPFVTVTVYTVVAEGDTTMLAPVLPPGCQVYPVAAAAAVKVAGVDAQITELELIAAT